jgi:hypothetical protein
VVELALTPAGRAAVAKLLPTVVEQTNLALEPLTKTEFRQFRDALVRILDHVQHDLPPIGPPKSNRRRSAPRKRARPARTRK